MRADVHRWLLAIAIVALVAADGAQGQSIADLPTGARVRITLPDSARQDPFMPRTQRVIGTFARASADTLWLQIAGPDTVRVARGSLRKVEVSRGVSRARSALEFGLAMGLGVGLIGYGGADDADSRHDAIGIGVLGAVTAAFIGAARPYERWRRLR